MILIIDNYDSFTYNLAQEAGKYCPVEVVKNDEITVDEIIAKAPNGIILSPGPGRPEDAGITLEAVSRLSGKIPVLGVCLGHQAICLAAGGKITYAKRLMHGKSDRVGIDVSDPLFSGLAPLITVGRYHSLAADPAELPDCLAVTATSADGEIMAVRHKKYKVFGVQFHPESVLTPDGDKIISNFARIAEEGENSD